MRAERLLRAEPRSDESDRMLLAKLAAGAG